MTAPTDKNRSRLIKPEENNFFTPFSEEARQRLLSAVQIETYPKNTRLFEENDRADNIYLVLSGEVDIVKKTGRAGEAVLATVQPGDYFGEMGAIDDCGRSAGAHMLGKTEMAVIPATIFRETLQSEPSRASLYFLRHIDEHLRSTNTRFIDEFLRKEKLHTVGEMAASIIHDFKNSMCAINLTTGIILKIKNQDETTIRFCRHIQRQVEHMAAMVQDILDYTQGKTQMDLKRIHVRELLRDVEVLTADFMEEGGIDYTFTSIDAEVEVDDHRLIRVFQNILNNAVNAVGEAGGKIIVEAVQPDDETVELRVTDNGSGIPVDIQETLFDPFVTAGKRHGVGLGMAVARTIVEAHGGTITFETEEGGGSTFIVRLPALARIIHEN